METFKILGQEISFNEDFFKYIDIYNKKDNIIKNYTSKYNAFSHNLTTMDELITYIDNLKNFVVNEYNSIADKIIEILVNYQIFDKTISDILYNNQSVKKFDDLIYNFKSQINDYLETKTSQLEDFKRQSAIVAENSYDEYYTNVISSSIWDIIVNDTFNDLEAQKVARKRQRLYDRQVNKAQKSLRKEIDNTAQNFQTQIQETVYKASLLIINEMFLYCLQILILNNKLSSSVLDNMQKEKANNILNNIERIQDSNIKKEQLIIALKSNPFSIDIHSKILDYIENDSDNLNEYIKLVKFINYENNILEICISKCSDLTNTEDKYVKIIKLLDEKYLDNFLAKVNTIEDVEDSNPNINLSISKKIFYINYDCIFEAFLYAGNIIGKIQEQNKVNGHIVVKCSISLHNILNPTTIDIKISKENVSQTKVEISSLCKNDGGGVLKSPQKWKEKLLEEVNKKLGIYTNTYNSTSNIGNSKDNSQVSQSIGKNIYKFSDVETLTFDKNCKDILNIFLSSSYSIGTIKKLDRKNNHIIINRSFSLLQMTPPTTIDIKFSKIDENKSTVTISTLSKYGELFGSPRVWKNKLLKKVHKIMDII